jgi:hypothetical protein
LNRASQVTNDQLFDAGRPIATASPYDGDDCMPASSQMLTHVRTDKTGGAGHSYPA